MPPKSPVLMNIREEATFFYLKEIGKHKVLYDEILDNMTADPDVPSELKEALEKLKEILNEIALSTQRKSFSDDTYSNLYIKFQEIIKEIAVEDLKVQDNELRGHRALDPLFLQIYENDSKIHDEVAKRLIYPVTKKATKNKIAKQIEKKTATDSKASIEHPDNPMVRFR